MYYPDMDRNTAESSPGRPWSRGTFQARPTGSCRRGRSNIVVQCQAKRSGGRLKCSRKAAWSHFPRKRFAVWGANVHDEKEVARIFEVKTRPLIDPLIVHAADMEQVEELIASSPRKASHLAESLWPGPPTLVLPKRAHVPEIVTAGMNTVGVRIPARPVALQLIKQAGVPVAAPSANRFGRISPSCTWHVREQLGRSVDITLDGGGAPAEKIESISGSVQIDLRTESRPQSTGRFHSHYAPIAPLLLGDKIDQPPDGIRVGLLTLSSVPECSHYAAVEVLSECCDLREAAASLHAALHRLDCLSLDLTSALPAPDQGLGITINDRLSRASRKCFPARLLGIEPR